MKEPLKNTGKIITKVKKYKTHTNVYFDGEKLELSDDIFSSFYLYKGKSLSNTEYQQLVNKINNGKLFNYALKLLSDHLYSEYKIREKLYHKEASKEQVEQIIQELKKRGFIDDNLLIEEYLAYATTINMGKGKIKDNLLKKGVFAEKIAQIDFPEKGEINKAKNLLPKLVKRYDKYNARSQKDHIIQAYLREGFDLDVALNVCRELDLLDTKKEKQLLKKDYDVLLKRYSRKYQGRELKEHVYASLVRKGYKGKDIMQMMGE